MPRVIAIVKGRWQGKGRNAVERSGKSLTLWHAIVRAEVWLFAAIAAAGLLGFMSTLSPGDVRGEASGDELVASLLAQEKLEELMRQPLTPRTVVGALTGLEPGFSGTFRITPVDGGARPRQARIAVSIRWGLDEGPPRTVTLETIRGE
jgi:hypothetical protein